MSEIDDLRNRIDTITLEMTRLLKERMDVAEEIGRIKKDIGIGVTDESRESNLREKVVTLSKEIGLDEAVAARYLNFMVNEAIKAQSANKNTHLSVFLKAKSLEQQGKKIIHMEVGEPDFAPPQVVIDAAKEMVKGGAPKYGQVKGMPKFRDALARHACDRFDASVTAENIMVSPGARFAVFAAITTLLNPGEEIIIIEPAWPAYKECALNSGIKVRTINTTLKNGWEPSLEQIEDVVNFNTKMIILNYPNNPTGKILPDVLQDGIVGIARKNDLYVLSDEIYSQYTKGNWKSVLSYNYEKSIVIQSFSKSHAMTGFRIGYAIADKKVIRRMAQLQALCLTNVSEAIQHTAMMALEADTSDNTNTVQNRLDVLVKKAGEAGLDFVVPDGAMYIFGRVNRDGFDGAKFADDALERGLAVAPGEGFGDYTDFVRISACQKEKTLIDGMNILCNVMEEKQ